VDDRRFFITKDLLRICIFLRKWMLMMSETWAESRQETTEVESVIAAVVRARDPRVPMAAVVSQKEVREMEDAVIITVVQAVASDVETRILPTFIWMIVLL
jgi:hypothetical protein